MKKNQAMYVLFFITALFFSCSEEESLSEISQTNKSEYQKYLEFSEKFGNKVSSFENIVNTFGSYEEFEEFRKKRLAEKPKFEYSTIAATLGVPTDYVVQFSEEQGFKSAIELNGYLMKKSPENANKKMEFLKFNCSEDSLESVYWQKLQETINTKESSIMRSYQTTYNVQLHDPDGVQLDFKIRSDQYILDAAEEAGINYLPYSDRAGASPVCVMQAVSGTVDQSDQSWLNECLMEEGYFLPCVAYATSDLVANTHMEVKMFYGTSCLDD